MIRFLRRLLGCRCEEHRTYAESCAAQLRWNRAALECSIERIIDLEDKLTPGETIGRSAAEYAPSCKAPTYQSFIPDSLERDHIAAAGKMVQPSVTHPIAAGPMPEGAITTTTDGPVTFLGLNESGEPTLCDLATCEDPAAAQPVRRARPRKAVLSTPRQRRIKADSIAPAEKAHWKVCTRCGGPAKPITDFYPASNGKGFRPECKECTKRQVKEASARKQREQSQPVKREMRTDPETQEVYTHPPAPVGTDKERDAAVSKTATAKAAIKALCLGDTVTVQKSNGESLTGICKGRNDACFYIAADWGSESYTVSDLLLGDVIIVKVERTEEAAVG